MLSVDDGFIPFNLANSNCCPFKTHITPIVFSSVKPDLLKNNLYCVLSGMTIELNKSAFLPYLEKFKNHAKNTQAIFVPTLLF